MVIHRLSLLFGWLLVAGSTRGQAADGRHTDELLTKAFQSIAVAKSTHQADSAAIAFKQQLMAELSNPQSFHFLLDSLARYVSIQASADRQIRFFSWQAIPGGSWQSFDCVAQFRADDGSPVVQQISTEQTEQTDYSDSRIYEIHNLQIEGRTHYLCFAWGTHGSGLQHQVVRMFAIRGRQLTSCINCMAGQPQLLIQYPRHAASHLTYNPDSQSIHFHEFQLNAEEGYYLPTGNTVILVLTDGVFAEKKQKIAKDQILSLAGKLPFRHLTISSFKSQEQLFEETDTQSIRLSAIQHPVPFTTDRLLKCPTHYICK